MAYFDPPVNNLWIGVCVYGGGGEDDGSRIGQKCLQTHKKPKRPNTLKKSFWRSLWPRKVWFCRWKLTLFAKSKFTLPRPLIAITPGHLNLSEKMRHTEKFTKSSRLWQKMTVTKIYVLQMDLLPKYVFHWFHVHEINFNPPLSPRYNDQRDVAWRSLYRGEGGVAAGHCC